jgi:hypothetical protein
MIYHDNTFTTLATAPVKSTKVEVALQLQDPYGYYDGDVLWHANTPSGTLMSVAIDAVGSFLGTVTKKATVKLLGIVDEAVAGDIFQVRLGVYNNDPSVTGFNNISVGFFVVDEIAFDYEAGSTTVTMFDWMWTASQTPYSTGFNYPTTVESLAGQVTAALGVSLMVGFSDLPNADYEILEDLYVNISNATLQTVIQEIAASTGTTARFTDTTLVFSKFEVNEENLDSTTLKRLRIGDPYGPVTSVVLGRVPQNDNIVLSNNTPNSNIITSINDTTNLFTITSHSMSDGTLVQIRSDGTLPSPLTADTNYFVFTGEETNTFALTATYADAIAGTNIVDLTDDGSGTITLSQLVTQEVQINNIEILDDDREDLLPELYEALLGISWHESESETVGLGWHEVGDVIQYTQGSTTYKSFLSEVHVVLAGSIRENLVSVIPNIETINYQTAGGILKTIYNTEIQVDKQNNDITSIVSQQVSYQDETLENFTEVYQAIDGVTTQIQSAGGGNFIINSVGRAVEPTGAITAWATSGVGTATSYSSAGSLAADGISGFAFGLEGASIQIQQRIQVATVSIYSMGFRVNKLLGDGAARVYLVNDVTSFYIDIETGSSYNWEELKVENISPGQNFWDVIVVVTDPTTLIEITDLRVLLGKTLSPWVQSHDEILNTQVALTTEGIRVSSSSNPGDYTVMTPIEFKGYSVISGSSQPVFWLNRDTTRTQRLSATDGIDFGTEVNGSGGVIRAVVVQSGSRPGIAFVGAVS